MLQTKPFDFDGELDATQACQDQLPNDHDFDSFFLLVPFGRYLDPWDPLVTQELQMCLVLQYLQTLSSHTSHHCICLTNKLVGIIT